MTDLAPACPGCGVRLADPGGTHPQVGTSAGCWAAYGDLIAREYREWSGPPIQRVTVSTYGAQHPGEPTRAGTQGLVAHLIGLHLAVEKDVDPRRIARAQGRAVADPSAFHWLEPPAVPATVTIADVTGARTLREHEARVQRWARAVWESWADHHEVIRGWAGH